MDYEKKYKEALEWARKVVQGKGDFVPDEVLEKFPELKESKDEKIKRLLHSISKKMSFHLHDIFTEEEYQCFDAWFNGWLEKQGEKDVRQKYLEDLLLADDIYQMAMDSTMVEVAKSKAVNALSKLEISKLLGLEKQGEQKSFNYESVNIQQKDFAPKVEPKFHEGDWIIINGLVLKIQKIQGDLCEILFQQDELRVFDTSVIDNEAHLWTIEDAKDGDVLVCDGKYGQEIGIVKKYIGKYGGCDMCFNTYCFVDWDGIFRVGEYIGSRNIHPATKEQRNLLFQKMKEAGYEWDAENKKLNKIEPKFHEGEWVIDKYGHVTKIMRVNNNFNHITYVCCSIEDNSRDWPTYSENDIRLWDISDAKDGDVLVASDNSIFIFSHCIDNACVHHIAFEVKDNVLNINDKLERCWETIRGVCPSTKEQRDILFQKMKEGGFEFDFENKKLKKIN